MAVLVGTAGARRRTVTDAMTSLVRLFLPSALRELRRTVREDWIANGYDWTRPGFRALAVYRIGVYADAIRAKPLRAIAMRIYLAMHRRVRNRYGVELEHTARVGRRLVLAHQANIVIHPYAHIGDDCLVRQNVTIGAALHRDYTPEEFAETAPTLEDGVQVGCGATILGRVVVGRGARIGPNAVVICDVPAGATVFAPPSRMMLVRPDSAEGGDTLRSVTV